MSRFSPKQYATALFESLQEAKPSEQDMIVKSFASMLAKHYDRGLLPKIVMQFKKLERAHGGAHEVVVTSARPLDRSVLKQIGEKVGTKSRIKEVIDPFALGGIKVLINDELVIDGTYQGRIARTVQHLLKVAE